MTIDTLKQLQETELNILIALDQFCSKHNIVYSLYGGTAIGAIRHAGFIPWDDDIDIAMTRGEFNRFCDQWNKNPIDGYYLETLLTDNHCGICHAKLRKEGTLLLSKGEIESVGHHGIWVDVFPLDKITVENSNTIKKNAMKLILLSRANVDNTNDTGTKKLVKFLTRIMFPDKKRYQQIQKCLNVFNKNEKLTSHDYVWKDLAATYLFKYSFSKELPYSVIDVQFNNHYFHIYSNYDEMLRVLYGDYMKLPPIDEQVCKHDPIKIQFEN